MTITVENLTFNNTRTKLFWNGEFKRDIIEDLDGSLKGSPGWLTHSYPHLVTSCTEVDDVLTYGAKIVDCDNSKRMVKFNLNNLDPAVLQNVPISLAHNSTDYNTTDGFTSQVQKQSV